MKLPSWLPGFLIGAGTFDSDGDKMGLAVALARENVLRGTGGPFGAAVFEQASGRLVAAGVNCVESACNSLLHAEVLALMVAEARVQSYTLRAGILPAHVLVTSCEPCAMCLGAVFWSGIGRIVCGASRADAAVLGFDEGPVFPASYRYLEARGVEIVRNVGADDARDVMALYREKGGTVYNG